MYISTAPSPEGENFQMKIYYPALEIGNVVLLHLSTVYIFFGNMHSNIGPTSLSSEIKQISHLIFSVSFWKIKYMEQALSIRPTYRNF